jgi:hypothetical protein
VVGLDLTVPRTTPLRTKPWVNEKSDASPDDQVALVRRDWVERFERGIDATNATLAPLDFCPAGLDPPRTHRDAPSAS